MERRRAVSVTKSRKCMVYWVSCTFRLIGEHYPGQVYSLFSLYLCGCRGVQSYLLSTGTKLDVLRIMIYILVCSHALI